MKLQDSLKGLLLSGTAITLVATLFVGVAPQPAYAAMQEIVVTARKRDENILEVPFAISAFSEQDLQRADLKDFADLSLFTPGLTYQNAAISRMDRGTPNIIIRGLNVQSTSGSSDGALLFIDGAPIFGGEIGSFIDIERVEVLRGPQTAYFGRNTLSGAINLVTKDPGEELGGSVGVEYGSYETSDLQGTFEGSIVPEKLAFRVSGRRTDKGGQYVNNFNGKREIGEQLSQSIVGTLVWKPTDTIKLKVRGAYSELEDAPAPGFRFGTSFANCDPDGNGSVNQICGNAPSIDIAKAEIGAQNAFDPAYFNNANFVQNVINVYSFFSDNAASLAPNGVRSEAVGGGVIVEKMGLAKRIESASFDATIDLPGDMTFNWISAYSETKNSNVSDENTLPRSNTFSGGGVLADIFIVDRFDKNQSHEARILSGSEQRLRWLGGINYITNDNMNSCVGGIFGAPYSATCRPIQEVSTLGVFGGLYFDLTDKWTISGELRFQNDEISIPSGGIKVDFDNVGGRLTAEYALQDDVMLFANYARGFRPGGFNSIVTTLTPGEAAELEANTGAGLDVDPEQLDQIELGVKGAWLDSRLQGSAAIYWGKIIDQQNSQVGQYTRESDGLTQTVNVDTNIGQIDLYGLELEGAFQATDELAFQGSFAWNYTEYAKGECRLCVSRGAQVGLSDHLGNQLRWVPEYTASFVTAYERPVFGGGLNGFARAEVLFESTKYASEANLLETGDRTLVNLRLGVDQEVYRVEFYVTNLLDNDTYYNVNQSSDLDTFGNGWLVGLPDRRAFGIRATLNY